MYKSFYILYLMHIWLELDFTFVMIINRLALNWIVHLDRNRVAFMATHVSFKSVRRGRRGVMLKFGSTQLTTLAFARSMAEVVALRSDGEFNMPVKETVKSVNNNQLLRTYDTEDSFTRRRDSEPSSSFFCLDCVYKQMRRFSSRKNFIS